MDLFLEDFGGEIGPDASYDAVQSLSYEDGISEGRKQALDEVAAANSVTLQAIEQRLSDVKIGYAEAQRAVLQSLRPLFRTITDTLLHDLAQCAQIAALHQLLSDAAEADSNAELRLVLPLESDLADRLPHVDRLSISSDDSLHEGQALLVSDGAETLLDTARARQYITDLIGMIAGQNQEKKANG